jgi:hypothetical protein
MIGARGDAKGTATTGIPTNGRAGDQGGEISPKTYKNSSWKQVLRYGGKGSGLDLDYASSKSGKKLLLDNSGRFSGAGADTSSTNVINKAINKSKNIKITTSSSKPKITFSSSGADDSSSTSKSTSSTSKYSMSKETAALLKVIISLVEQLVTNTNKVDSIYDIVKEYCENSGNSEASDAVSEYQKATKEGTTKSKNLKRKGTDQNTLDSLADLKEVCNRIISD